MKSFPVPSAEPTATLAARVIARLGERGLRIAAAESLTGGLLAAALVSVPGASRVVSGAVVAYDTLLKHRLLGVEASLLREHGPVNESVALQMARGVRETCATLQPDSEFLRAADCGVATTGVAGPDPDAQTGAPAGTVWVAVSVGGQERAILLAGLADMNREEIRAHSVNAALQLVLDLTEQA